MSYKQDLINLENSYRERFAVLSAKQSKYDRLESQILHFIEIQSFDAVTGSKLVQKLKKVRIARRKNKVEFYELESVLDRFKMAKFESVPDKSGNPYAVEIEEILGTIIE